MQQVGEITEEIRFLELTSHELRTPLAALRGTIRLLIERRDELPPETTDAMLEVLDRSSERLEARILDLLAASEVSGSDAGAPVGSFRQAVSLLEIAAAGTSALPVNGHHVTFSHDGVDLRVKGSRDDVEQIIARLLDNAVKFTEHDGQIDVHVGRFDNYAVVSITDDGPGIRSEDQERIFERFVTLGDLMTRHTTGLGMGLFIVRNLVESMGGSITVRSKPGEGATFRVKLPLA